MCYMIGFVTQKKDAQFTSGQKPVQFPKNQVSPKVIIIK